jgi:hypothetical protein
VRKYIYPLLIVAAGTSCDYEPDSTHFVNIPPPNTTGVTIDLNNSGDTISVFQSTLLHYTADVGAREIYEIVVYFDNTVITSFSQHEAAFYLSSQNYPDGQYALRIEMFTSSGTHSLADVMRSEKIKVVREWVAYIDRTPPQPVQFTRIDVVDGTLRLEWDRYKQHNFQAYELRKYRYSPYWGTYTLCWTASITDQRVITTNDYTFMGGEVRYEIQILAGDQSSPPSQEDFAYVYNPAITYTWLNQQEVQVTWRKAPLYKNFTMYSATVFGQPFEYFNYTSINDTAFVFQPNVNFGSIRSAVLNVHGASTDEINAQRSTTDISVGKLFPSFYGKEISYNTSLDKYFAIQYVQEPNFNLVRINGSTLEAEQTLPAQHGAMGISENGQYLYLQTDNGLSRLDPLTFDELGHYNTTGYRVAVSNNNLVGLSRIDGSSLIKMPENTIVKSSTNQRIALSPSGKYILMGSELFEWDGTELVLQGTIDVDGFYFGIFKGDEKLILVYVDAIKVVDIETMAIENTISNASSYSQTIVYDPVYDLIGRFEQIGYGETGTYYLYKPDNPNVVKTFTIGQNAVSYSIYHVLLNGHLLCSTGFIAPLSYFYP